MQPSTARDSGQVDPRRSTTDIPPPQSAALGLHLVARRLLLFMPVRLKPGTGLEIQGIERALPLTMELRAIAGTLLTQMELRVFAS